MKLGPLGFLMTDIVTLVTSILVGSAVSKVRTLNCKHKKIILKFFIHSITVCKSDLLFFIAATVKPVNKGHPKERSNLVFIDMWSLPYLQYSLFHFIKVGLLKCGSIYIVVFI